MYKLLIRPVFFLFDPERIHHAVIALLRLAMAIPGIKAIARSLTTVNDPSLERELFGLHFANPVGIAAGFDKNAEVFEELSQLGFSHIEIGTVTPKAQPGNPKKRLFRLRQDQGLINRMGFNNKGLEAAIGRLRNRSGRVIIGGNIGKNTLTPNADAIADYVTNFEGLFPYVDYFVVNVSCPNISDLRELQDQDALMAILNAIQQRNKMQAKPKPVLLKVSPDLNEKQLDEVIFLVKETGIQGVVATNTTISRNTLEKDILLAEKAGKGGLSGLPIRDRSTEVIRYLAEKSGKAFPIIGVGGIFTPKDALEKIEAGADLVQVYTGFIYEGPLIAKKINKAILKSGK
ncbi:MAG: quinone-dependent dihydroorotate dehydrogenase [Bacteroidetes bacterium]|nr:quinone-dependent dihydroorotate dehydrogenase [Bacteroidota bacterium]MBU1580412.1 quinone-dependent dihydroorotate dehydrogenase [Bacteroidota bacterium]MBU2465308.1 quinone-dependent dihydroorotate dehydrogenase [Bacteroidota bacterium]MBU2556173.1 quinone-dependent dihydroorotate dehydrogenase [Bacteroidota bacterium]